MALRLRKHSRTSLIAVTAASLLALTACSSGGGSDADAPSVDSGASSGSVISEVADQTPVLRSNIKRGAQAVPVSTLVRVATDSGALTRVELTTASGPVPGEIAEGGGVWRATERLEPATTYTLLAVGEGGGESVRHKRQFTTQGLAEDAEIFPSVAPLAGQEVGIGMPVLVFFDYPVVDQAEFERHMHVRSAPKQVGTWHWISDREAHWRPKSYWKPGTEVTVDLDLNGVSAGAGRFGQEDRSIPFTIGSANIYRVNAQTHQMKVFSDGELLRTIPITTGKSGYTTRSGTKVIMEKFESKRMSSETTGIPAGSAESYDIAGVKWAMRLTYSGEFVHAAPWSVGSQGRENVSHGCTGMSTENAGWLYAMTKIGDVVETTGTDRPMELANGYGDWNLSFEQYAQGSALA